MATITIPRPPGAAALDAKAGRLRSLVRGHAEDPVWARPALIALLAVTLIAYLVDLTASGYANSFYAAAVQAGTKSWKALFFGSIDSSNFITVDKPPASLWVMEAFLVVPGFALVYLLAAPVSVRRRVTDLLLGGVALLAATGVFRVFNELMGGQACLAAPLAYSIETISTPHTGSVPSAGPAVSGAGAFGGGGAPGGGNFSSRGGVPGAGAGTGAGGASGSTVSSALVSALKSGASRYRWVAATSGSQSAASLELASGGEPVMAIGGQTVYDLTQPRS